MVTTITELATTLYNEPLKYPGARHIDVDSTGKRWVAMHNNGNDLEFWYSSDPSSSWTKATGDVAASDDTNAHSFFIDVDDGFHILFREGSWWFYRYGTESGGTITWRVRKIISSSAYIMGDVVAHKEGSDYYAHCVVHSSSTFYYQRIKIAGGASTFDGSLETLYLPGTVNRSVSIDFRHTGDGKTVASSSPDLWISMLVNSELSLIKMLYSSGPTWTAQTLRVLSASGAKAASGNGCVTFDGTAVMVAALAVSNTALLLFERDAADTTTTSYGAGSSASSNVLPVIVADSARNIYVAASRNPAGTIPGYVKWTRIGTSWGSWIGGSGDIGDKSNFGAIRHNAVGGLEIVATRNLATDDVVWELLTAFTIGYDETGLSVAAVATVTGTEGFDFTESLSVAGVATVTGTEGRLFVESLNVAAISDVTGTETADFVESLFVAAVATVTGAAGFSFVESLFVAGIATIAGTEGWLFTESLSIAAESIITGTEGWLFAESLNVAATTTINGTDSWWSSAIDSGDGIGSTTKLNQLGRSTVLSERGTVESSGLLGRVE